VKVELEERQEEGVEPQESVKDRESPSKLLERSVKKRNGSCWGL